MQMHSFTLSLRPGWTTAMPFGELYINYSGPSAVGIECGGSLHTAAIEVQPCDSCKV